MPVDKKPAALTVDFTGVEVSKGRRSAHVPEGDYLLAATDYEMGHKKDDPSTKMIIWTMTIVEPKAHAGKVIVNRNTLSKEALWSLRSLLSDMLGEEKVPQSSLNIPLAKIVAAKKKFGASLVDNEYNGKLSSQIGSTFPASQWAERSATASGDDIDEDTDDEEVKAKATSSDDDEDMDEIDVDDI